MERARVLLLTTQAGGGGAQRVMALVAQGLPQARFEVHVALTRGDAAEAEALPRAVRVHALKAGRARAAALPLLRLIWRLRPEVILCGAPEISFAVLLLRPFLPAKTRLLVRQNSTVSAILTKGHVPWYTRLLYRLLYRRADCIICQSRAMADDLQREAALAGDRLAVLPNPIDVAGIVAAQATPMAWSGAGPHLLAAGRLAPEKGFDLLIEAMAAVRRRFPEADLVIAGSGKERAALLAQSRSQQLEDAVHIADGLTNPYGYFAGATVFVLSSRYEGMPNALLEAAAAGLPLVATPASGGVIELLRGREGTWLAREASSAALAAALIEALESLPAGARYRHAFLAAGQAASGGR